MRSCNVQTYSMHGPDVGCTPLAAGSAALKKPEHDKTLEYLARRDHRKYRERGGVRAFV